MIFPLGYVFETSASDIVCYIGEDIETGKTYNTLIEAIMDANRETIHLTSDVTFEEGTVIPAGTKFAVDGQGDGKNHKITLLGNVKITGYGAEATFNSVTVDLNGFQFYLDGRSKITLNDGAIFENGEANFGGAAFVQSGTFTMNEGSIVRNCTSKNDGGAFALNGAKFDMNGGIITGCSAATYGGAISAIRETTVITLTDGKITGNTAQSGGAVYVDNVGVEKHLNVVKVSGDIEISDNTLSDSATYSNIEITGPDAFCLSNKVTGSVGVSMAGAKNGGEIGFVENESITEVGNLAYDGGAYEITAAGGKLIVTGDYVCYVGDNEETGTKYKTLKAAIEDAGDKDVTIHLVTDVLWEEMSANQGADFTIDGKNKDGENYKVTLLGNITVRGYSNRAYFSNVTIDLSGYHFKVTGLAEMELKSGAVFENGYDSLNGGGAAFVESSTFTMNEGSLIKNCEARTDGGAVRLNGATFTMNGGKIENCIAGEYGGAVAAIGEASKVILASGEIGGNKAVKGGGIYSDASSAVSLSGNINVTGNNRVEDNAKNNIEIVSDEKLVLAGSLTGMVGVTFPDAKNGTVFGKSENVDFLGAENISSDSDDELTARIDENSKLVFEKRSTEDITLEEVKKEAGKELKALSDDVSSYMAEINSAENAEHIYGILDTAAGELGAEIITLPYNRRYDIASVEILYQGVSADGKKLSDRSVISVGTDFITASGLGRAIVKSGDKKYLIKTEKAKMAIVLVTGQSNSAGAESNYEEAPSAEGRYKGRYLVTNSMDWSLSVGSMSIENAVYTAEHGGKPENPLGSWSQFPWGAGAANQLGARLSDEWDMTVWVVNAGRSGYRIDYFDPTYSDPHGYTSIINYMNKAYTLAEENGHYIVDKEKTGMFWIQGCSNGAFSGHHSKSMEEYRTMFMNMYEGLKKDIGINYCGIWLVRAGKSTNSDEDFYMSGPRMAQIFMGNSSAEKYKDIYLVLNTDIWRFDEGVKNHYINRYSDKVKFEEYYGYSFPETLDAIKPGIHYSQKGYNEMGDIAGEVMSKIMSNNSGNVTSARLYDYYGNPVTAEGFKMRANEEEIAIPVVENVYYNAGFDLTVKCDNEAVANFDNESFKLKGIKKGETTVKVYYGTDVIAEYPVKITEDEGAVCYIGDSEDSGIKYSSLLTAISEAAGREIHLIQNVEIPAGTRFEAGTKFSLNGKSIGGNYVVKLLGQLNITGYGTDILFSDVTFDLNGFNFWITGPSKVTLNSGTVLENGLGGPGGAAFIQSATFTMNEGSVVRNCVSKSDGGAFSLNGCKLYINGGTIEGCESKSSGGAIASVREKAIVEIKGGIITKNKASNSGGAIYINAKSAANTVKISGNAKITGNTVSDKANNIEVTSAAAFILGGDFTGRAGITINGAAEGVEFGTSESNAFEGAENIVSDKTDALFGAITSDGKLKFKSLHGSDKELDMVKEEAEKEIKTYTGGDVAAYIAAIKSAKTTDEVYEILDGAANELNLETITLNYKAEYKLSGAEILYEGISYEGKMLSDSNVITYSNSVITVTGLGRAVVKTASGRYLIKTKKSDIALVLVSGQSNSAGAYSDYTLAPSATGKYKGRFLITNTMDSDIPLSDISFENAKYTAENGGRPLNEIGNWAQDGNKWGSGAASALGARLSDEWDMTVWVVNTGVCAQVMDNFTPAKSSYKETVSYVSKVKSLIEDDGHYNLITDKTGLFWIQGCSDGIGTSSENTMKEYLDMFTEMYKGWKKEIGINYGAIWLVRAGTNDYGPSDFYMSGPRLAQIYMGNSDSADYKDIHLVFNTDVWRTNEGVQAYFEAKYPDANEFFEKYGYELPKTYGEVKPDVHYRQKGYNELGDEAGRVVSKILGNCVDLPSEAKLLDYYGNEVTEEGIEVAINGSAIAVPMITNITYNASFGLKVKVSDESIATFSNESFTVTGHKTGESRLDIYFGETKLASYKIIVTDEILANNDCYIGEDYESGTKYESFVTAIKAANGETVHLLRDVTWPAGNIGTTGGFVVDGTNPEGGTFTIKLAGNSTILNEKSAAFQNVTIDLNKKHFQVTGTGAKTSNLVLKGGTTVKNGYGSNGGFAIINDGGIVVMEDGSKVENCTATGGGGAFHANGGTLTMTGGSITGNKAESGGGVVVAQTGTFNVSGTATVTGNTKLDGSIVENVKLTDHDSFNLAGSLTGKIGITISAAGKGMQIGIVAGNASGAENVFMDSDSEMVGSSRNGKLYFPVTGEAYIGDSIDEGVVYGDFITAIKAANGKTVHLLKDVIWPAGNIGTTGGYVLDGTNPNGENFTVTLASDIESNLRIVNEANGVFSNVTIDLNGKHFELMSTDSGAAKPCVLTLKSGAIIKNGYAANGGAAIIYSGAKLFVEEGSRVENCVATGGGGAFHVNDGTLTMTGGSITGNKAGSGGGIVVTSKGTLNISGDSVISGNTLSGGDRSNITLSDEDSLIVTGDFSGNAGITFNGSAGKEFGISKGNFTGSFNFNSDSEESLYGFASGGKLIWVPGKIELSIDSDTGVYNDDNGNVESGTIRFITKFEKIENAVATMYGTLVMQKSVFEEHKADLYKGNLDLISGYIAKTSKGTAGFIAPSTGMDFAVDLVKIPAESLDTELIAVSVVKLGDSVIFKEHTPIAVNSVKDEITGEVKVLGELKKGNVIGKISYTNPEDIILSEDEVKNTIVDISSVKIMNSLSEEGTAVTVLTDLKASPAFIPEKNYVKYSFEEATLVSGIRLIKDKNAGVIRKSTIYGSIDGENWFEIGLLKGIGSGTLVTDFGFNIELLHIAVSFDDTEKASAVISDMHIIKEKKNYKTIGESGIDGMKVYSPKKFKYTVNSATTSAGVDKLFDGIYDNYWHSGYTTTSDGVVPTEKLPHIITVLFGEEKSVSGVRYYPRNGSNKVTVAEIYGTVDGSNWYFIAKNDSWKYSGNGDTAPRDILFGENLALTGIKFVSVETQSNVFSTGAELEILSHNMGYVDGGNVNEITLGKILDGTMTATGTQEGSNIDFAFDGNEKTSWVAKVGEKPTFTFTFDSLTPVSGVRYTSVNGTTLKQADILISEDGINFKKFATATFDAKNEYIFKCNVLAKAVKIEAVSVADSGVLISEFKFLSKYEKYNDILLSEEMDVKETWKFEATSEAEYAPIERIFDGNIDTYWHSWHSGDEKDSTPIDIIVDFNEDTELSGFNYYPRRTGTAGTFYNVDTYASVTADESGEDVWELIKSEKYSYKTGNKYEVQKTEFDRNYTVKKLKIHIAYGEGNYASGAEIRFLKPDSAKPLKGAELISKELAFDPEEPTDVFAEIAFNDCGNFYGLYYNGNKVFEGYYRLTDDGILLTEFVFSDIVDMMEPVAVFTAEFFQGKKLEIPVSVGRIKSYKVKYEKVTPKGTLSLKAVSDSGKERIIEPGEEVKVTETLVFTALPTDGYKVSGWDVANTTKLYEKLYDRSGWILEASTTTSEAGTYCMIDGKESTYWHSGYTVVNGSAELVEEKDKKPYYITITFPEELEVAGFSYLPRQDSSAGRITDYEVYKKGESGEFDVLIKQGSFTYNGTDDRNERSLLFDEALKLKEVQIKINNTTGTWGHIAELYALKESDAVKGRVTYTGTAMEQMEINGLTTDISVAPSFEALSGDAKITYELEKLDIIGSSEVTKGESLNVKFLSQDGYHVPESIKVMLGGNLLKEGIDYTYVKTSDIEASLTVKNVSADIKIVAQGIAYSAYMLTYRDEYGAIGKIPEAEYVTAGNKVTVAETKLTLLGYKFVGWKIYYEGISEADEKVYPVGTDFTMPAKAVVLSTAWEAEKDKPDRPSGGRGGSGGSGSSGGRGSGIFVITNDNIVKITVDGYKTLNVTKGTAVEAINKDGYEFLGYYLDPALTVPYSNTGANENLTLYPSYRKLRSADELKDISLHWAKEDIEKMYIAYLVNGKAEGIFAPDNKITRAEFCQILYLISGESSSGYEPFDDVNVGDWYAPAVAWAYNTGVTGGTSESEFSPNGLITREQMAVMIYRYATKVGAKWIIESELNFVDKAEISEYAIYQVNWALEKEIIKGYPDDTFLPKNNPTRAEAIVMLSRMMSLLNR